MINRKIKPRVVKYSISLQIIIILFSLMDCSMSQDGVIGNTMTKARDDAWNIAEGKQNGYQSQVRYRPEIDIESHKTKFPKLLTIVWSYKPNEEGNSLPFEDDYNSMQSFETKITDRLEDKGAGIISYIITSNSQRTFYFYINDVNAVSDTLNTEIEPGLPITLTIEEDAEWQVFKDMLYIIRE